MGERFIAWILCVYFTLNNCCCCRCPNLAVQEADDSEGEEEEDDVLKTLDKNGLESRVRPQVAKTELDPESVEVQWVGDAVYSDDQCKYYRYCESY